MNKMMMLHNSVLESNRHGFIEYLKMDPVKRIEFEKAVNATQIYNNAYFNQTFTEDSPYEIVCVKNGVLQNNDYIECDQEFICNLFSSLNFSNDLSSVLYAIKDGEAHIPVTGVLKRGREIDNTYYKWGKASTYNEIIAAVELANKDSRVTGDIVLDMNTPGGDADGVEDAARSLRESKKNTRTDIYFWMMSAGLYLGVSTKKIRAMNENVQAGSLGVAYEYYDYSGLEKEWGLERHTITSENAPDKRPEVERLDELLQKDANELEEIFINRVATGRNQTEDYVKENYGRGWDLIASKALEVGMIDEIVNDNINIKPVNENEGNNMDLTLLKEKHPDLYNQVFKLGIDEGKKEGAQNERDRIENHLSWFENGAKIDSVIKNIRDGKDCDTTINMQYAQEKAEKMIAEARVKDDDGHQDHSHEKPESQENFNNNGKTELEKKAENLGLMESNGFSSGSVSIITEKR